MDELTPCLCEECECTNYADPPGELCYDCEHGIHDGDEGDTDG